VRQRVAAEAGAEAVHVPAVEVEDKVILVDGHQAMAGIQYVRKFKKINYFK
jgi:hypothetical protein